MTDAQDFLNQLKDDLHVEYEERKNEFFNYFLDYEEDEDEYTSENNSNIWSDRNYRDWSYKVVDHSMGTDDEDMPTRRDRVVRFSKNDDDIYVHFTFNYFSWDEIYYNDTIHYAHLVQPKQVMRTVYEKID